MMELKANHSSFVFREFLNETGWPDGIAWLLGVSFFDPIRVLPC